MSQGPLDAVEVSKINSQCERSSPPKFHDTRRFYADARYQSGQKRPTTAATKWRSVEHVNLGCIVISEDTFYENIFLHSMKLLMLLYIYVIIHFILSLTC